MTEQELYEVRFWINYCDHSGTAFGWCSLGGLDLRRRRGRLAGMPNEEGRSLNPDNLMADHDVPANGHKPARRVAMRVSPVAGSRH
jgi:hypothetical protein